MSSKMSLGPDSRKRGSDKVEGSSAPPPAKLSKGTHPFFLKPSERPPAAFVWKKKIGDTCMHGVHLYPAPSAKIAAFDLDGTLIKTKSGSDFPRDKDDWMWWRNSVPQKLKDLHQDGFAIVMVSNQGTKSQARIDQWKQKLPLVANQLEDIPFRILAARGRDGFRKPMLGMWTELEKMNQGVAIDKSLSFFVGDAAGRPGDHGDSDRKWALNIGIPFSTPEEYFLGSPSTPYTLKGSKASSLAANRKHVHFQVPSRSLTRTPPVPLFSPSSSPLVPLPSTRPELVLFVGYPASGKSTLYKRHFQPAGYEHVNQDVLKIRNKCKKAVENFLKEGKSCVVDNTNRNVATRKEYIDICKKLDVPARCINFTSPLALCWHNNLYRAYCLRSTTQAQETARALLPQVAFTSFRSGYEEPTVDEGFAEVKRVNWRFEGDEEDRIRWDMWLEIDNIDWLSGR